MGLILDTPGSHVVTRDQLQALPPPVAMGSRHRPIPHCDLIDALVEGVNRNGWAVVGSNYGVAARGATLFGTMQLQRKDPLADITLGEALYSTGDGVAAREMTTTLGFRSSTNETIAPEGVAGEKVTVCSNMCFSGDMFAFKHKSTIRLNLPRMIADGLERFEAQSEQLRGGIERLRNTPLGMPEAKARIFDIFNSDVLPSRLLKPIARHYFRPTESEVDCQPRNLFGLNNACTRSIQTLSAGAAFDAAHRLGHHFKLGVQ